jgi:hypothetical protein
MAAIRVDLNQITASAPSVNMRFHSTFSDLKFRMVESAATPPYNAKTLAMTISLVETAWCIDEGQRKMAERSKFHEDFMSFTLGFMVQM